MADSLLLMVLALVVFGPRRLPQIGKQIGKLMYEFRKASNDFKFQMEEELRTSEEADRRKREEAERQQRLALAAATQPAEVKAESPQAEALPNPDALQLAAPETVAESLPSSETAAPANALQVKPPASGETVGATRAGRAATFDTSRSDVAGPDVAETRADNAGAEAESRAVTETGTEQTSRHG